MNTREIVVKAAVGGISFDANYSTYNFQEGELGVLHFRPVSTHANIFQPFVVWSGDSDRRPRVTLLSQLVLITSFRRSQKRRR
jgi:hypothetical protein